MHERSITSLDALREFAADTLKEIETSAPDNSATTIALHGTLGAGKTAFTQALAALLGVSAHVASPTFVVMRTYPITHVQFSQLIHIDVYRIDSFDEMEIVDLPELFRDPKNLMVIEWAERIKEHLPASSYHIEFSIDQRDGNIRTVRYGYRDKV